MNSDSTDNRAYSHKGLDSTANGQSTTEHGISSEPSARDRAGIGDFAFTEINKFNRQVHIECLGASDLQKYRDVITFITNDDSLLSNMGALRMARHMDTIADALATAQREAAGLRAQLDRYEPKATEVRAYFFHDNHCFTPLTGTIDNIIEAARELIATPQGQCGALCPLIVMDGIGEEMRRVGPMVGNLLGDYTHFDERKLAAWRAAALADADVVRLTHPATEAPTDA